MNMTPDRSITDDLEPDAEPEILALAERLLVSRPLPSPAFRGELGRRLAGRRSRRLSPARARAMIAAYSASGTALLVVGAVVATSH
jgi:hypothetical protein